MLLASSDEAFAWVRWVVLAAGVVAVACLVPAGRLRRVALAGVAAAVLVGLAAPGAYAVTTAATAHSGSIPSVGTSASAMGGPGGPGERGGTARAAGRRRDRGPRGWDGRRDGRGHQRRADRPAPRTTSTWSAAVSSAQSAAGSGAGQRHRGDVHRRLVGLGRRRDAGPVPGGRRQGEIHYYIGGGQGGGPGGGTDSTSAQIAAWVEANYPATTVGGQTVYDLTT